VCPTPLPAIFFAGEPFVPAPRLNLPAIPAETEGQTAGGSLFGQLLFLGSLCGKPFWHPHFFAQEFLGTDFLSRFMINSDAPLAWEPRSAKDRRSFLDPRPTPAGPSRVLPATHFG